MKRITTCIGCHYFIHDKITGSMRCANGARTWANEITEQLEEIQIDCGYWTKKEEPIIEKKEPEYVQMSMF